MGLLHILQYVREFGFTQRGFEKLGNACCIASCFRKGSFDQTAGRFSKWIAPKESVQIGTVSRIPQMNYRFENVLGRFCYKNQCNTTITMGQPRVTRRMIPENPNCGSISTVA